MAFFKRQFRRAKWRYLGAFFFLLVVFLRSTGLYMYFAQENYFSESVYASPDVIRAVDQLLLSGADEPALAPPFQRQFDHGYQLLTARECPPEVDLLLLVKSAVGNAENRLAIRRTWGLEGRFDHLGYVIRVVYLLALPDDDVTQMAVEAEQLRFDDIVQGAFLDRYYNNTLKTLMGFRWAVTRCPTARYVMFADDDFYVSVKNLLRLIGGPRTYPQRPYTRLPAKNKKQNGEGGERGLWYTGHLFFILPVRFYFHKFFVSLDEYPYNVFPPFVNAGAFLVNRDALFRFHYMAMYTPYLKLDDVYVGILAKRLNLRPQHNRYFFPYRVPSSGHTYRNLIATHGFRDPQQLIREWNAQFEHGNA